MSRIQEKCQQRRDKESLNKRGRHRGRGLDRIENERNDGNDGNREMAGPTRTLHPVLNLLDVLEGGDVLVGLSVQVSGSLKSSSAVGSSGSTHSNLSSGEELVHTLEAQAGHLWQEEPAEGDEYGVENGEDNLSKGKSGGESQWCGSRG